MKKILVMLLCLTLLCTAVACNGASSPSESEGSSEANTLQTPSVDDSSTEESSAEESLPNTVLTKEEQLLSECKAAYLDFLRDKNGAYVLFSLVYVDDDPLPELYLSGASEAEGDMICTFRNGAVEYQYLSRIGGAKYAERSGSIINRNGHMGLYYDTVYQLDEDGFSLVLSAKYTERYEHIGNEEYNVYRDYFIDGTSVSEAEYNRTVNAAFDFSVAVDLYENAVSYGEILEQLQEPTDHMLS